MKSFSIITLTNEGVLALNNQNNKRNDLQYLEKLVLKKTFLIEHLQDPAGIKFQIRPKISKLLKKLDLNQIIGKIKEGMQEENVFINVDYKIIIEE